MDAVPLLSTAHNSPLSEHLRPQQTFLARAWKISISSGHKRFPSYRHALTTYLAVSASSAQQVLPARNNTSLSLKGQ